MRRAITSFARSQSGNVMGEFALLLPLVLAFLLGMIDVGRYFWEVNKAEKATQMAARYAAVTFMVPISLSGSKTSGSTDWYNFATDTANGLTPGDAIPSSVFPGVTCTSPSGTPTCTCNTGGTCNFSVTADATTFSNIVQRATWIKKDVSARNVKVEYLYSGIGFAGDPTGPNVTPLVRVSLTGVTFTPLTSSIIRRAWTLPLPSSAYTLTMEDGRGTASN